MKPRNAPATPRRSARVTMNDVAREAGVSQAAVSLILSGKDRWVSDSTRQRVLDAARELGYRYNYHARLLRTGKTHCLAMVGNLHGFALHNYVFTNVCRGVTEELEDTQSPYSLLLFGSASAAGIQRSMELIEQGMVDGLLWVLSSSKIDEFERETVPWLAERNLPFVAIHSLSARGFDFPSVGLDSAAGGRLAAKHLAKLGYKDLGIYLSSPDAPQTLEMLNGFKRGLADAGAPFQERFVFREGGKSGQHTFDIACDFAREAPREKLPRALFVTLDASAYGLWKGLQARGLRVPEDVALVGFDDEIPTRYLAPELTTIHHPFREKGQEAVRLLTRLLDEPRAPSKPPRKILAPTLVVRKSCGA
ncbi:MAG: LacI family transcriptional regulator [Planctomycetota bacterium]|nr:LacI family transcriptional regulator [Planctomycetota bacterium]